MKNPLELLGLGDGEGNVSSGRVFMFIFVAAWTISKVHFCWVNNVQFTYSESDCGALGLILGGGIGKNYVENLSSPKTTTPTQP